MIKIGTVIYCHDSMEITYGKPQFDCKKTASVPVERYFYLAQSIDPKMGSMLKYAINGDIQHGADLIRPMLREGNYLKIYTDENPPLLSFVESYVDVRCEGTTGLYTLWAHDVNVIAKASPVFDVRSFSIARFREFFRACLLSL